MGISKQTERARVMRREMTDAERRLWHALRGARLPWKVRRQHPIGAHIADFAIPARKLIIEVDGGQHGWLRSEDEARSAALAARGYRVIRFWNDQVLRELDSVMEEIGRALGADCTGSDNDTDG
ncbi:endonuclease domain-containing protein [Solimonas marina]|uniref:Endonuclease domain-containing protein n=1 Tax=Solimonas marina TaxID=2714601 RepID=A0A969W997_9GAMM|nr:DUF559 domain-containing protein [Solimonas marina]NKF21880.1 endonuclease domain-containing protein [Solimonas marina]